MEEQALTSASARRVHSPARADVKAPLSYARPGGWTLLREFLHHSVAVSQDGRWRLAAVRAHALPAPTEARPAG